MPWSYPDNIPDSMKYLKPSIQKKAISISNAVLNNGGEEGTAIAVGIKNAKKQHDKKKSLVKLAFVLPSAIIGGITGSKIGAKFGNDPKQKQRNKKIGAWTGFITGAFGGAYGQHKFIEHLKKSNHKYNKKFFDDFSRQYKAPARNVDIQSFFKEHGGDYSNIKTKLEAKKIYRNAARKHHPDLGGNAEKFKKLSQDWERIENSGWFTKLAIEQRKNWANRHPLLSSGLALAGGIAAADMGVNAYKFKSMGAKSGFNSMKDALVHGAKEGSLYGGILGATEPLLLHGVMRKKVDSNS